MPGENACATPATAAAATRATTSAHGGLDVDRDALERAIERSGGWISGDDLAARLRSQCDAPLSLLARWIATGQVLVSNEGAQARLPLFQFDLSDLTVRPGLRELIAELAPAYQGDEILGWFATPNLWMDGALPIERIADGFEPLLPVARADRFIATGW